LSTPVIETAELIMVALMSAAVGVNLSASFLAPEG
jgi:hypothetical protein